MKRDLQDLAMAIRDYVTALAMAICDSCDIAMAVCDSCDSYLAMAICDPCDMAVCDSCDSYSLRIYPRWIPRSLNWRAEKLSKFSDNGNWQGNENIFKYFNIISG